MQTIQSLKAVIHRIVSRIAGARRKSALYCGQCERWERCGLPPHRDCVPMLAQVEQDGGRAKIAWWRASLGA